MMRDATFAYVLSGGVADGQIDYTFTSPSKTFHPGFAKKTEELFRMMQSIPLRDAPLTDPEEARAAKMLQEALRIVAVLRVYAEIAPQSCTGRRFGFVDDANMGLFPGSSMEGDMVVFVAGAKVPLVVREIPTRENGPRCFKLVGPAFVEQAMYHKFPSGNDGFETIRIL